MVFDSLMLSAVSREIEAACLGQSVGRVVQATYTDVYLIVDRAHVCLSCTPELARVHLADEVPEPPKTPPPFGLALRKHLQGARLDRLEQPEFDRVLWLHFSGCQGFGPQAKAALVAEAMGRRANLVLLDTGRDEGPEILACAKQVPARLNRYREVLPGADYVPPPSGRRLDPRALEAGRLGLLAGEAGPTVAHDWLSGHLHGASAIFVNELCFRAGLDPTRRFSGCSDAELGRLHAALTGMLALPERTRGFIYQPERRAGSQFAYPIRLAHLSADALTGQRETLSAAIGEVANSLAGRHARERLATRLHGGLARAVKRARTKLAARRAELAGCPDPERERRLGELLLAHASQVPPGAEQAELTDYYLPDQPTIVVELDPRLSVADNAQRHFARYRRAKRLQDTVPTHIAEAEEELDYLGGIARQIETAEDAEDMREIERELVAQRYLAAAPKPARATKAANGPRIRSTTSPDGYTILYGRSNLQNEYLLRHLAAPQDIWLHAQSAPGAHVIIKRPDRGEVPRSTLVAAARIAARNSDLRHDSQVPVDYTERRHVRKPKGTRPGFVHYADYKTIVVRP